ILKILHEPSTVEPSVAEIAGKRSEPTAAQKPSRIAHGIFTMHASPVGQRSAGNNDRPEQFRPNGREHHHRPSRLTIPNDTGLAFRVRMQADHLFEKECLRARHVLNGLARHWFRQETYEVTRVPGLERDTDFAVVLEPTNARTVARARVDDNERSACRIELNRLWRHDSDKSIVDRTLQRPPIDDKLHFIVKDVGRGLGQIFAKLISALAHHVQEEHAALRGINQIFECWCKDAESRDELAVRTLACCHSLRTPFTSWLTLGTDRFL